MALAPCSVKATYPFVEFRAMLLGNGLVPGRFTHGGNDVGYGVVVHVGPVEGYGGTGVTGKNVELSTPNVGCTATFVVAVGNNGVFTCALLTTVSGYSPGAGIWLFVSVAVYCRGP